MLEAVTGLLSFLAWVNWDVNISVFHQYEPMTVNCLNEVNECQRSCALTQHSTASRWTDIEQK